MPNQFRRSGQRRRRTHWTDIAGAATIVSSGSSLLATSVASHEGETIVRIRGLVTLVGSIFTADGDGFFGAFGVGVVTTAAATAGVTSIPTPITEGGWDGWMLHNYLAIERGETGVSDGAGFHRVVLDSKAMRKLNEDESLVFVWEGTETGTVTAAIQFRARILSMTN